MNILFADPAIVTVFSDLDGLDLSEFTQYFFSRIPNCFDKSYKCSSDDILRSYDKTIGLFHSTINIMGNECELFDTGGQRCERKKWISIVSVTQQHYKPQ